MLQTTDGRKWLPNSDSLLHLLPRRIITLKAEVTQRQTDDERSEVLLFEYWARCLPMTRSAQRQTQTSGSRAAVQSWCSSVTLLDVCGGCSFLWHSCCLFVQTPVDRCCDPQKQWNTLLLTSSVRHCAGVVLILHATTDVDGVLKSKARKNIKLKSRKEISAHYFCKINKYNMDIIKLCNKTSQRSWRVYFFKTTQPIKNKSVLK